MTEQLTNCSNPDCKKQLQEAIDGNKKTIEGHNKTLYGEDGLGGLVLDNMENKNWLNTLKDKLLDKNGHPFFFKKISPSIWVPILLVVFSIACSTVYSATSSASKEELKETNTKVELVNKDVIAINNGLVDLKTEVKESLKEVKESLKEVKTELKEEQRNYYENIKELMHSLHRENKRGGK